MPNNNQSDTTSWDARKVRQAQQRETAPQRKGRKRKKFPFLLYLLCVILVSALLAGVGWLLANDLCSLNKAPVTTTIVVEEDDSISDVAQKLKDAGLINYKWFFCLTGKFLHADKYIEPGEYENISSDMDYRCLIHSLHNYGSTEIVKVTIPEGKTVSEIFDILVENKVCTREELEKAATYHDFENRPDVPKPRSEDEPADPYGYTRLEGYLFPDTYEFYVKGDAVDTLDTMLSNFERRIDSQLRADIESSGYSLREIIILASIIEKESNNFLEERANIASVLYNRLRTTDRETYGMLQIDSTIDYALALDGKDRTEFSTEYESPYNTYTFAGFPAGAICNPGLASITAAVYPNDTDYYYFAAGVDGHSHFFTNVNDHFNFVNSDMYKAG